MQIISHMRASVFKDSYSAFKIARAAQNDLIFAKKIISAKSKGAHLRLEKLKKDSVEYKMENLRTQKYDVFLKEINNVQIADKDLIKLS